LLLRRRCAADLICGRPPSRRCAGSRQLAGGGDPRSCLCRLLSCCGSEPKQCTAIPTGFLLPAMSSHGWNGADGSAEGL